MSAVLGRDQFVPQAITVTVLALTGAVPVAVILIMYSIRLHLSRRQRLAEDYFLLMAALAYCKHNPLFGQLDFYNYIGQDRWSVDT
jgi:hypothetical protein